CIARPSLARSPGSSMKGHERPCSFRPQLRSSQNVLRRSVEPAGPNSESPQNAAIGSHSLWKALFWYRRSDPTALCGRASKKYSPQGTLKTSGVVTSSPLKVPSTSPSQLRPQHSTDPATGVDGVTIPAQVWSPPAATSTADAVSGTMPGGLGPD